MSTAKAALEIDAKQFAHNVGGKNIRVNLISAGPYASRTRQGIGDIHQMIDYAAERRRCRAASRRRKSPTLRPSCAARWHPASPGTSSTSIAASTSWACETKTFHHGKHGKHGKRQREDFAAARKI